MTRKLTRAARERLEMDMARESFGRARELDSLARHALNDRLADRLHSAARLQGFKAHTCKTA